MFIETIYDVEAFNGSMEKIQQMMRNGNFGGTRTRRFGIRGDIESAFGWHAGEPGQPITDNSITDEMRAIWLEKLIPDEDTIKTMDEIDKPAVPGSEDSSPREIIRWMQNKRRELLGLEPTEEKKKRRADTMEATLKLLLDNT